MTKHSFWVRFAPNLLCQLRIRCRLTPVYTEGNCEAPMLKKKKEYIIALCPQVYIVDWIKIRHLNLLLYHEMALRDQISFVWLQKKTSVLPSFICACVPGGATCSPTAPSMCVTYCWVSTRFKKRKEREREKTSVTHCSVWLNCTSWTLFVLYCGFNSRGLFPKCPFLCLESHPFPPLALFFIFF